MYTSYQIVIRGGPSHSQRLHIQKILWLFDVSFLRYARRQTVIQRHLLQCFALLWGWSSSSSHGSSGGGSDSSSVSVVVVVVVVVACWCRMRTSLLSLLTRGLSMSTDELAGIVPLVSVFCALFSHVLTLMHDVEFFEDQPTSTSVYLSASSSISYLPEYWTRSVSRQEVVGGDQTWV